MSLRLENVGDLNVSNTSQVVIVNSSTIAGQVGLLAGSAFVGTINTIAIGGGTTVDIVNSAGWIVGLGAGTATVGSVSLLNDIAIRSNTNGTVSIINSSGWIMAQSNTEGMGVILRTGTAVIGTINLVTPLVAGTAVIGSVNLVNPINILNSAGWVISQSNTEGLGVILRSGTALIGSINLIQPLLAGTALIGSASVVNALTGIFSIANSTGWVISIANTSGIKTFDTIETMQMSSNGVAVNPNFAVVNVSLTNNTVIAASAGRILKVLAWELMAQVPVNATWESGTGGTKFLTGPKFFGGSGGMVAPFNPVGWFQTQAGSALNLKLSGATSIGGSVVYLVI